MTQLWLRMTACDLGRGIDNGSISPLALVKTYINAIKKHNPGLIAMNAYGRDLNFKTGIYNNHNDKCI